MVVYALEQRWEILWHYFENHGNIAECLRKLRTDFGRREAQSAPYVRYLMKKVKETDILIDKPKCEKPKTVRTRKQNYAAVAESVCKTPSTSIYRRSQQLNISETSLRRILHKDAIHDRSFGSGLEANWPFNASFSTIEHFGDIGMTPYKVQLVQKLKPIDLPAIDLQKMPILAKKKTSFQMKPILLLAGM